MSTGCPTGGVGASPTGASSYPLLRITARFLQVDHARVMMGFGTIAGGYAVLCEDPKSVQRPEAAAIIDFEPHSPPATVEGRILEVLGQHAR